MELITCRTCVLVRTEPHYTQDAWVGENRTSVHSGLVSWWEQNLITLRTRELVRTEPHYTQDPWDGENSTSVHSGLVTWWEQISVTCRTHEMVRTEPHYTQDSWVGKNKTSSRAGPVRWWKQKEPRQAYDPSPSDWISEDRTSSRRAEWHLNLKRTTRKLFIQFLCTLTYINIGCWVHIHILHTRSIHINTKLIWTY